MTPTDETRERAAVHEATAEGTPPATTDPREERRQRLLALRAEERQRAEEKAVRAEENEIERLELVSKFTRELGPENEQFAIYDGTHLGEGHVVVKLGPGILLQTYFDSKMTPADRYDFISTCIAHPTMTKYNELRARRPAIDIEVSNRLARLFGAGVKVEEGKS